MKSIALALIMMLCLLFCTACHTDNDPWPTGDALLSPTATSMPTEQPTATIAPTMAPTAAPTAVPTPDPTDLPGGEAAPGING